MDQHELITRCYAIADQTLAYPYKIWGFGESIGLEAVWMAGDLLNRPDYQDRVNDLLAGWLEREPPIREEDHSAPGIVLLDAYDSGGDARYLSLAKQLADHMHALPAETSTNARFHRPAHPDYHHFIYVDCMEIDAPFLCRLAQVTGDGQFYDRGAEQILAYCRLLQDEQAGLFYHQFDGERGAVNGAFWGRGCGWAFLGLIKTLILLPREHRSYSELHQRLNRLADALAQHQLDNGAWPTVFDHPSSYRESSLSAMFCAGFDQAIRADLLSETFQSTADSAWGALLDRLNDDGLLHGVSIATPPGDADHYETIATGSGFPWGQGPALLACLGRLT